jgi:hypothetical protein
MGRDPGHLWRGQETFYVVLETLRGEVPRRLDCPASQPPEEWVLGVGRGGNGGSGGNSGNGRVEAGEHTFPKVRRGSQLRELPELGVEKLPGFQLSLATSTERGMFLDFGPVVPRKDVVQESLNPLSGQVCFGVLLCHVFDS